jgi:serine protease Do
METRGQAGVGQTAPMSQPKTWRTKMSKLFASVSALAMLTALAGSAQAEVVNGFTVEYWPKAFNGACSGTAYYVKGKDKTSLSIVKAYRDNTTLWGIMLANKDWKTKGNTYEVVIQAGPERNSQYRKTLTKVFTGLDDGGLLVSDLTANEMNTLAFDGEATVWFINKKDGKYIASLSINKSATVIRAVQSCLKEREPMVAKQDENTVPKKEKTKEGGPYYGTGFFVAPKYVLTAYHVVEKCAGKIYLKYPTYRSEQAFLIGHDKKNDLAVLKTDMTHMGLAKFRLRARLGEQVYSYGFPYGNVLSSSGNFTSGGVSALTGYGDDSTAIQVSSPLQPGNSGGPLMDSSGAIIGISKGILGTLMAAEAAGGAVPQNVNFGVSSGTAVNFLGTIRSGIDAEISTGANKLEPEAIAEIAMKFTVQVSCD